MQLQGICDQKDCPLNGKCLTTSLVYEAAATDESGATSKYIGLTEGTFKGRYNQHTSSFRNVNQRLSTELSKHVWSLKDQKLKYKTSWRAIKQAPAYRGGGGRCELCLTEKLMILTLGTDNLLNRKTELVSKCRHANKFLLKSARLFS